METVLITDLNDERVQLYSSKNERQLRYYREPNPGVFVAESPRVIERAIAAGYQPESFLIDIDNIREDTKQIISAFENVPVYGGHTELLTTLTGYHLTRGLQAVMKRKQLPTLEELCVSADRIVILEEVENPTNVGAIFRSAAALSVDAVLLTKGCSDPLYRRSARVSMGTVFQIPWTYVENWPEDLQKIKKAGFATVALALGQNTVSIEDSRLNSEEKLAMLLGTEGDGLAETTIVSCDYVAKIPMRETVDSLNVAAASAVAFWQLTANKRK